jgi:uncharacterized protein (TIGR00369 family)
MKRQVLKKQYNTHHCMVCGLDNRSGLKARFYELDNGEVLGTFTPLPDHQGYPGRLHGGMASALLDETIARTINLLEPETWAVTVELNVRYRKPVPMDCDVVSVGRLTRDTRRIFEGKAEILLENGEVAVEATGKFMKLPFSSISDKDLIGSDWQAFDPEGQRDDFDVPETSK